MHQRNLGSQGLVVSAIGLGCMGMSQSYGPADEAESLRVLDRALEIGITFWDTAEAYGPWHNEELLERALRGRRDRVVLATKFAYRWGPSGERLALDGSPEHVKEAVEGSLKRLGTDHIDLFYQHRLDPAVPIEDTVGAMAELVQQGKVRYLGLSEVGPGTIRRAHAVHPLSAVQSEYSLWERGVEEKVLPALRELGIGFVPYSPLGRGFLTGTVTSTAGLGEGDFRRLVPRFQTENLPHNLRLVECVKRIAAAHGATPAQVALAWLLRQGPEVVPIPGTKRVRYLGENAGAMDLRLPAEAWAALDREVAAFQPAGERYPEAALKAIDRTE